MRQGEHGFEAAAIDCSSAPEALSADLDGELGVAQRRALDTHLAGCAPCRALRDDLRLLHRAMRLRPAEPVPDLSARILAVANPPRPGSGEWIRTALLVIALGQLALAVPGLLGRTDGTTVHVARHLGSLELAFSLGLVYAVWRPVRAFGLLPMAGALAAAMSVTSALDIAQGRAAAMGEAHHVLDVAGLVLLWALAGAPRPWGRRGPTHGHTAGRRISLRRPAQRDADDVWSDAS